MDWNRRTPFSFAFFLAFVIMLWLGTHTIPVFGAEQFSIKNTHYEFMEGYSDYVSVTNDPGNLKWSVDHPEICRVFDGQILGLKAGEAKITVSDGKKSVALTVIVHDYKEAMGLNSRFVVLYPGETFQFYCGEESAEVKWSVGSRDILAVSKTGKVRAKKTGTTFVRATYGEQTSICDILVVEKSDRFVRVSSSKKFSVTTERTILEAEQYFLIVDAGIYLPENCLENISLVMKQVEEETGYSFYPSGYQESTPGKLEIYVTNTESVKAYSTPMRLTISQQHLLLEEGYGYTIAHELIHVAQMRNTGSVGDVLSEGYAETYAMQIIDTLHFPNYNDEEYKQRLKIAREYPKLDIGNVRKFLAGKGIDHHASSYFFVSFLNETVDAAQMRYLHEKAAKAALAKREELQDDPIEYRDWEEINFQANLATIQVLREELGNSVISEFMKWYNEKIKNFSVSVYEAEENERISVGVMDSEILNFGVFTRMKYKKRLVVDYQNAIAYLVQYKGQKYKGLYGYMTGTGTVKFYDKSGKLVSQYELKEGVRTKVAAPKAVKYAISGGEDILFDLSMAKCFEGLLY